MRMSDENLRGRPVIAADGQVIGELAASSWTAPLGASSRSRSSCARTSLTDSVPTGACSMLERWRSLFAWFSRSATPLSSRCPWMSFGRSFGPDEPAPAH